MPIVQQNSGSENEKSHPQEKIPMKSNLEDNNESVVGRNVSRAIISPNRLLIEKPRLFLNKQITIDYDFWVHLYTQRLFKSELSFGKGRVILPTKTTLCNFWSMLYKLIYCCLFVLLLSHFWLIHFFHLHLLYQPYLGLCQAQCVQSHQRQPMSAVAITACEVQVSAADSQTVPTVAAGV